MSESKKKSDKRKKTFYLPMAFIEEIEKEAVRQDRSSSWIIQRAWLEARDKIKSYPSLNDSDD